MVHIDQVAQGIYRIASFAPTSDMSFNQFLIEDQHPTLIHTGTYPLYEAVRQAVAQLLDPARLAYIIVAHFEADECGGMGRFVAEARQAVLVCSLVGAAINVTKWDYTGPVWGVHDGEVLDLGSHRLRFWETPHVHHWDSLMVVDETTRSLFPADLFLQPGDQPAMVQENLSQQMCRWYRETSLFAAAEPVLRVVKRLEQLDPWWVHPMHGGSLPHQVWPHYRDGLRSEPFAFVRKIVLTNAAELTKEDPSIMWRKPSQIFMYMLAMPLLLTWLAACGSGTNTAPTSLPKHSRPTPARPAKGTVLFEAKWSGGLTGWQATAGWNVLNGILQSDESDTNTLTVPYRPAVTNYAIEFRARIVKVPSNNAAFGSFLISVAPQPGRDGYKAVVIQIPGAGPHPLSVHPQVEVYTEPIDPSNPGTAHDQEFGSQWHAFRVETQGGLVNFSIDGQLSGRSASNQTSILSTGPIQLVVSGIILQVSDFRITVA